MRKSFQSWREWADRENGGDCFFVVVTSKPSDERIGGWNQKIWRNEQKWKNWGIVYPWRDPGFTRDDMEKLLTKHGLEHVGLNERKKKYYALAWNQGWKSDDTPDSS